MIIVYKHRICKAFSPKGEARDMKRIKIIALDLDGTTLNSEGRLSEGNRAALRSAAEQGIHVVVSTGRTMTAVPEEIMALPWLRYLITSNGAQATDLKRGERVYSSYLAPEVVAQLIAMSRREGFDLEVFCEGTAYIDAALYQEIRENKRMNRRRAYVLATRTPIADLYDFLHENRERIENVNILFEDEEARQRKESLVRTLQPATLTSSFATNIEVGGVRSSKKEALIALTAQLGIAREELMCCGDAANDIAMIEYAGVGVAMGNAWEETKASADYVTVSNDEDGVAEAIVRFALRQD